MNSHRWAPTVALLAALALSPQLAVAAGLDVEIWTDRGNDAVYDPGDVLEVQARTSEDAFLLVYELDAEGYVRLLFPYHGNNGHVPGGEVLAVPDERSNLELVVQEPVGQAYIVAIASREPFAELPWYLRPFDAHAEELGYEGGADDEGADDEEGITAEGRIVGDPFVAMERIRRRVIANPDDPDAFATGYTSYYVHQEVKYPRYLCYDCHRPGHWAWWTDFDPYYTTCSVFEFRVNYSWYWGPGYWFGYVPYYWYVPRYGCAPVYSAYSRYSPWGGWTRWKTLWGGSLTRYKTPPPAGYIGPTADGGRRWRTGGQTPPGLVAAGRGAAGIGSRIPIGRRTIDRTPLPAHDPTSRDVAWRGGDRPAAGDRSGRAGRAPRFQPRDPAAREARRDAVGTGRLERPGTNGRRGGFGDVAPRATAPSRIERPRFDRQTSRIGRAEPAREREMGRIERPRFEGGDAPRIERPRFDGGESGRAGRPAPESPRIERVRSADPPGHDRGSFERARAPEPRPEARENRGANGGGDGKRAGRTR